MYVEALITDSKPPLAAGKHGLKFRIEYRLNI